MSESSCQFIYSRVAGANSSVLVHPVVTSKSIVNVYQEGREVGGDGRQ
jgi:hypothetical protein